MIGGDLPVLVEELDHAVLHGNLVVQGGGSNERLRSDDWRYLLSWQ